MKRTMTDERFDKWQDDPVGNLQSLYTPVRHPFGFNIWDENESVFEGLKVLLIEDTADMRILFSRIMTTAGADVIAVASAEEAWSMVFESAPEVIVSDIGLPDEDGISFMKKFRRSEACSGRYTPAVALTAYCDFKEPALRAGFDCYLAKPTMAKELLNTIETVLQNIRAANI